MATPSQHTSPTPKNTRRHNWASGCTAHRHNGSVSTLLTFMVVCHHSRPKQTLAISTECAYNARILFVGCVWKHSRIYLFRKNMMRLGWGNFALKRPRSGQNRLPGRRERRFWEQLNAHSEQLNATMCHQGTDLVAFTLGSHQFTEICEMPKITFHGQQDG